MKKVRGRKAEAERTGPKSLTSEEVSYIEEGAGPKGRGRKRLKGGDERRAKMGSEGERREKRGERREARGARAEGLTSEEVSYIKKKFDEGDARRRCC